MNLLGIRNAADLNRAFPLIESPLHIGKFRQLHQRICKYLSHIFSPLLSVFRKRLCLTVLFPVMVIHGMLDPFCHCFDHCLSSLLYRTLHDLFLLLRKVA